MTKKVRLNISSIAPLGDGVSIADGSFYYVPGAIPGDEVDAEIIKRNKRDIFTRLLRVVHPSDMRREPVCPVFGKCGGCSLLHADESLQRDAKREALKRQFARDDVAFISDGPALGYRRLARLHVHRLGDGGVQLGFYGKRAHRIVDISACPVLESRISDVLPSLKSGLLRGLQDAVVRIATGNDGVYLHVETASPPDPVFYTEAEKAVPTLLAGVVLNWDGITTTVAGADTLTMSTATRQSLMALPVGSFGQANAHINNALAATVARWAKASGASEILELYAGAGNLSLELLDCFDAFTLVELDAR
ncbi:MAG: class I SAM-dependent RNA methyltransferase, partial [Deltaproteobacteria bacterium]|nr:class I SAM-dependent RNA methyltransferase [Deltaproteobacteria bacterium]